MRLASIPWLRVLQGPTASFDGALESQRVTVQLARRRTQNASNDNSIGIVSVNLRLDA